MRFLSIVFAAFCLAFPALAKDPCAVSAPCRLANGEYYLAFPTDWDGAAPLPVVLYFHGHNSSGVSAMKSGGLRRSFVERGYLLIAPNGARRGGTGVRAWPARPGDGGGRDDVAFSLAVLDDVARRWPVDPAHVAVAGFSAGGSMAWMMGCYAGARFNAVISVAGALRRPNPAPVCPDMAPRALHIHGFKDVQVPLEGRGIRDWHQGDVFETLSLFRRSNQCRSNPDEIEVGDRWRSRVWRSCAKGDLAFVEHDGGHRLPKGWTELARRWLQEGALRLE